MGAIPQRHPWAFQCSVAAIAEVVSVLLNGAVSKRRRWTYALLIWRTAGWPPTTAERHFMTNGNGDDAREEMRGHLLDRPPAEPPDTWDSEEIDECTAEAIHLDVLEAERHAEWATDMLYQVRLAEWRADLRRREAGLPLGR